MNFAVYDDLDAPNLVIAMGLNHWQRNHKEITDWLIEHQIQYSVYPTGALFFKDVKDIPFFLLAWNNE